MFVGTATWLILPRFPVNTEATARLYASAGSGPQSSAEHLSLQLAGVSVLEASVTAVLLFELHLGSRFVPPLIAPAEAMADSRSRDSLRTSWD